MAGHSWSTYFKPCLPAIYSELCIASAFNPTPLNTRLKSYLRRTCSLMQFNSGIMQCLPPVHYACHDVGAWCCDPRAHPVTTSESTHIVAAACLRSWSETDAMSGTRQFELPGTCTPQETPPVVSDHCNHYPAKSRATKLGGTTSLIPKSDGTKLNYKPSKPTFLQRM